MKTRTVKRIVKTQNKIPPLPAEGQSILYHWLEAHVTAAIWVIALSSLVLALVEIFRS